MEIGEIKSGAELGKGTYKARYNKFRWSQCPQCKKERWITMYLYQKNGDTLCQVCSGRKNGKINAKLWGKG